MRFCDVFIGSAYLVLMLLPAKASTYIYDFPRQTLSLDGVVQTSLAFERGAIFDFRIVTDGFYLSGDNPISFRATYADNLRISFDLLRAEPGVEPLTIKGPRGGFGQFTYITRYRQRGSSFDAYVPFNDFRCNSCEYSGGFNGFLSGYGPESRASTYRVTVSSVPLPAAGLALSGGLGLTGAFGRVLRKSRKA